MDRHLQFINLIFQLDKISKTVVEDLSEVKL